MLARILAALAAEGTTALDGVQQIDRGYQDMESKLRALGADVRREEVEEEGATLRKSA